MASHSKRACLSDGPIDGFSTPVTAGERIYISGKVGDDLKLFCFDLSGNKVWERTHGLAFREADAPHSPYRGARGATI